MSPGPATPGDQNWKNEEEVPLKDANRTFTFLFIMLFISLGISILATPLTVFISRLGGAAKTKVGYFTTTFCVTNSVCITQTTEQLHCGSFASNLQLLQFTTIATIFVTFFTALILILQWWRTWIEPRSYFPEFFYVLTVVGLFFCWVIPASIYGDYFCGTASPLSGVLTYGVSFILFLCNWIAMVVTGIIWALRRAKCF
jgi:hypothetical protein